MMVMVLAGLLMLILDQLSKALATHRFDGNEPATARAWARVRCVRYRGGLLGPRAGSVSWQQPTGASRRAASRSSACSPGPRRITRRPFGAREGLPFPILADPDTAIARSCAIRLWPTLLWMEGERRVRARAGASSAALAAWTRGADWGLSPESCQNRSELMRRQVEWLGR